MYSGRMSESQAYRIRIVHMRKAPSRVPARRPSTNTLDPLSGSDHAVRTSDKRKALLERLDPAERARFQKRQYWEEHRTRILKERKERYRNDPAYRARRRRESRESYARKENRRPLSPIQESRRHYRIIRMTQVMRAARPRWKLREPPRQSLDGGDRFGIDSL